MDFYSTKSLKHQSTERHVAHLRLIFPTLETARFCFYSLMLCVLSHSGEATNTNFIVFGLTQRGIETMIYHTRGNHANHYAIVVVSWNYCMNIYCTNSNYNGVLHVYCLLQIRTLRVQLLSQTDSDGFSRGSKRSWYLILSISLIQPIMMWWITSHIIFHKSWVKSLCGTSVNKTNDMTMWLRLTNL